jgi:hypothetical protein
MRKIITSLFLSGLVLSVAPITSASAKQIPPKAYSTCAALRKVYPNGVAYSIYVDETGKAAALPKVYNLNLNLKRLGGIGGDDGLLCEKKTK